MIIDAARLAPLRRESAGRAALAEAAFIEWLEKRLGAAFVLDRRDIPFGREDLTEPLLLGSALAEAGVVEICEPVEMPPDEPRLALWRARYALGRAPASGVAPAGADAQALTAALAEALERHLWVGTDDWFDNPRHASIREMGCAGTAHIPPACFASFTDTERRADQKRALNHDTPFLWIDGVSLASGRAIALPAQTASGLRSLTEHEPLIRARNTTGLATGPSRDRARLAGLLECIERDAWMTLWWNQLTLPRLDLAPLSAHNPALATLLAVGARYRLDIHAVPMPTDAPTHAVLVVVEDESGHAPRFATGLAAHRSLARAVEKALLEALRAREVLRRRSGTLAETASPKGGDLVHGEHGLYFARPEHAAKLAFLIAGPIREQMPSPWEDDTDAAHLARILVWCREGGLECVAFPLTRSKRNPTALHVEFVVMPALNPMHLDERERMTGGARWRTVPEKLGLAGRTEPFTAEPHPFD